MDENFCCPEEALHTTVADFVRTQDTAHTSAIRAAGWWQDLKRERSDWRVDHLKTGASSFGALHWRQRRELLPTHYVCGLLSPFFADVMIAPDRRRMTWAVSFSPFTDNATGRGQGGAIAAIFDLACAMLGHLSRGGNTPTQHLEVTYHKPLLPIPGVFRLDVEVLPDGDGTRRVQTIATLSDGMGTVFDTAVVVLVDLSKRKSKL